MTTNLHSVAVAIIPIPLKYNNVQSPDGTNATVNSAQGANVTAGVRSASSPLAQVSQDTTTNYTVSNLALNVQAYEVYQSKGKVYGDINWSADVYILGGGSQLSDTVTIDSTGTVTQNQGFTVNQTGTIDQVTPLAVDGPSIYFYGQTTQQNASFVPTFTFGPNIIANITIHDSSDANLEVMPIDVTTLLTKPNVYLDSPNLAISNNTSPLDFDIATAAAQPTIIDIEDDNPNKPYIQIDGINNPIGQTIIKNLTGNVYTNATEDPITTNSLMIVAGGTVGGTTTESPAAFLFPVQMVQYQDDSGVTHIPTINGRRQRLPGYHGVAGERHAGPAHHRLQRDLSRQRPGRRHRDLREKGLQEGPATATGRGVIVSATQQGQSDTYISYYYPDVPTPARTPLTRHCTGTRTLPSGRCGRSSPSTTATLPAPRASPRAGTSRSTGGVNLGRVLPSDIATIDLYAFLNLNPVPTATGKVYANINGSVSLWEFVGTMRVGTITSRRLPPTIRPAGR